ncbi:mannitol dehydrogenase [Halomonas sp. V046]|uniref:mannitol dehydrogenase family protein n=1 Tax=Halomonas sp. V046 TaxID=3459611 RepID=UPI004043FBA5
MRPSIMQFGIGRFLLAHVDYFAHEANAGGGSPASIIAVQSSDRAEGRAKANHLARVSSYPVQLRGRRDGHLIDGVLGVSSIATVLVADDDWDEVRARFRDDIRHVVSNVSESGYEVPPGDSPLLRCPRSFPAKLTQLLYARFDAGGSGVTVLPCELLTNNAQQLRSLVSGLCERHYADADFSHWLEHECVWATTLVDRIVSEALDPIGAVAEPYGLWAIQQTPGLALPFPHPDVRCVADVTPFEKRKLHVLNLAHSWLVAQRRSLGLGNDIGLVREAMADPRLGGKLETLLRAEVVPVLDRALPGMGLDDYVTTTLERFANPYLDHRLDDIAQHHEEKCRRRIVPVVEMARQQGRRCPILEQALARQ